MSRKYLPGLAVLVLLAGAVRLPAVLHQSGGQDEDYFAVPGWTLLQSGIPRIPYLPARDPQGVFFRVDEVLFALPPGFFIWQAPFNAVFGPGYSTGRLASLAAGGLSLVALFFVGIQFIGYRGALAGTAVFAFSRPFFFPATTARPDMLCTFLLLVCSVILIRRSSSIASSSRLSAGAAGVVWGLALVIHPSAVVLGPIAMVVLLGSPGSLTARVWAAVCFGGVAVGVAVLVWLPWILIDPGLFYAQFSNNVLRRAGPGLFQRLLSPAESLIQQSKNIWELCGPWQAGLFSVALIAGFWKSQTRGYGLVGWTVGLSVVLAVLEGTHPTKGYWSFPAAFACLGVGRLISQCGRWAWVPAIIAATSLIPGSGLRAATQYIRHWGDPAYLHRKAVAGLLERLPRDANFLVDVGCVYDFYLAGRSTTLALDIDPFFKASGLPFDLLVLTRTGIEQELPRRLGATERVLTIGNADDELAVYIEVWSKRKRED